MLSEWTCPTGSAHEGISSREATERSSSETAGGGLRSDSTFLTILGLSVSSWTEERATDTEKWTQLVEDTKYKQPEKINGAGIKQNFYRGDSTFTVIQRLLYLRIGPRCLLLNGLVHLCFNEMDYVHAVDPG